MNAWGAGLAALLAFGQIAVAANTTNTTDTSDLKARAEKEILQTGQIKTHSSDAVVSESMLHLDNPMPDVGHRGWEYFAALSVQKFAPGGTGGNDLVHSRFAMSEDGATVMPSVTFGLRAATIARETWALALGLGAHIGYATQKAKAQFETGYDYQGANLTSTMVSALPMITFHLTRLPNLLLNVGGEYGSLNYTQSAPNKLASFTERAYYYGESAGIEYRLGSHWSVFTNYTHRRLAQTAKVDVQPDNYELGTRLTW